MPMPPPLISLRSRPPFSGSLTGRAPNSTGSNGTRSRLCQGHRRYVLAMLALLEDTDYPQALQFADEGRKLEESDPAGGLQLIDDAIRLVASGPSTRLFRRSRRSRGNSMA